MPIEMRQNEYQENEVFGSFQELSLLLPFHTSWEQGMFPFRRYYSTSGIAIPSETSSL